MRQPVFLFLKLLLILCHGNEQIISKAKTEIAKLRRGGTLNFLLRLLRILYVKRKAVANMKLYKRKALLSVIALFSILVIMLSEAKIFRYKNDGAICCSVETGEVTHASEDEYRVASRLWELLFGGKGDEDGNGSSERKTLIVGGGVFGARIKQTYPTVTDNCGTRGILAGDGILRVDGKEVTSAEEIKKAAENSDGEVMELTLLRNGEYVKTKLLPKLEDGQYKLGIQIRDGAAGIGTITFIDPETKTFGGLGHGICDAETGTPIEMCAGSVCGVILGGVQKGEAGKAGELSGILTDKVLGTVYANTQCGVFGTLDNIPSEAQSRLVEVGTRSEVHAGEAKILSTVKNGMLREYSISICEIDTNSHGAKSFKIKVTDPTLIALTGGIVRGMSGSPIIQDGKLVGAVTHVLVADPTEGYGIFIENMLEAAESQVQPKAA